MPLSIRCAACKKDFTISGRAKTRVDLAAKIGEYSRQTCKHCGSDQEYHVNDIRAEVAPLWQLGGLFVGGLVLWFAAQIGLLVLGLIIGGAIITAGLVSGSAPDGFNRFRMNRSREEAKLRQQGIERKYHLAKKSKPKRYTPKDFKLPGSPF